MNFLKNKICYLGGPITFDIQENWRIEPIRVLTERFKIRVFDPFSDPKQQKSEELNEALQKKDYNLITNIAKSFVRKDLASVDRADFLISNLIYKIPTVGTHHEIINASNSKKPVMLVCEAGKQHISAWYYAFINHEKMFSLWEDLYLYLDEVNRGLHKEDDKWSYVYGLV